MARKAHDPLTIAPSADDLLAKQRHTDWEIAQERGRNRNGRAYLGHRVHGADKTRKARAGRVCRGKVTY